jgi:hypothetical protein
LRTELKKLDAEFAKSPVVIARRHAEDQERQRQLAAGERFAKIMSISTGE